MYKVNYETEIERQQAIDLFDNEGFILKEEQNITEGNFLIFITQEEVEDNRVQEILLELEMLDEEVPRILEDIIEQGNFIVYETKQAVIDRKIALREELKMLTEPIEVIE